MSIRTVRVGSSQPGGRRAENQQTDGFPNSDPLMLPGSTSLNRVSENSIRTEVRLLDHMGSPLQDHKAIENSLRVTVTPLQPGEGTRSPSH